MVIDIIQSDFDSNWKMEIDLQYVIEHTGKREIYYERGRKLWYIPFTKNHAKKIFKLIKKYSDHETIEKVENYLKENEMIFDLWRKVK